MAKKRILTQDEMNNSDELSEDGHEYFDDDVDFCLIVVSSNENSDSDCENSIGSQNTIQNIKKSDDDNKLDRNISSWLEIYANLQSPKTPKSISDNVPYRFVTWYIDEESILRNSITFKVVPFSIHTLVHSVLSWLVTVLERGFWKALQAILLFAWTSSTEPTSYSTVQTYPKPAGVSVERQNCPKKEPQKRPTEKNGLFNHITCRTKDISHEIQQMLKLSDDKHVLKLQQKISRVSVLHFLINDYVHSCLLFDCEEGDYDIKYPCVM
ncbi:hypothetical protein TNCV_2256651 [Trichonephila clavipes]|nr:hypothetical protein TNCV_2256651 [Trichonephila clavipes]